jgi:hypothetical protein
MPSMFKMMRLSPAVILGISEVAWKQVLADQL